MKVQSGELYRDRKYMSSFLGSGEGREKKGKQMIAKGYEVSF